MAAKPRNIDEYLAGLDEKRRMALSKLRKRILAAAPGAEECLSYGLAAFRLNGKLLVGFGASARHLSFHPMDGTTVEKFAPVLAGFDTSKGTIRFEPGNPLPAVLVRQIVRARARAISGG